MYEEEDTSYKDGDVVWVKLGAYWWPGEVKDKANVPEDVREDLPEYAAVVKFFEEDYYEYVKNKDNIYPYNCERKTDFIKKGMGAFRAKNPRMEKFPKDVTLAEVKTGGNENILSEPIFSEVKRNYAAEIFGPPTPKKPKDPTKTKPKSKAYVPVISHRRFLGYDDYEVRIMIQDPSKRAPSPDLIPEIPSTSDSYQCPTCSYKTDRINLIMQHTRLHQEGIFETRQKVVKKIKRKVSTTPRKPRKPKKTVEPEPVEEIPPPKEEKPIEKTSTNIRSDLLADWENDDLLDEEDVDLSMDVTAETETSKEIVETTSPKKSSCFDFDEEEEEETPVAAQEGRKIPRVIPPSEKRKSFEDVFAFESEEQQKARNILEESQRLAKMGEGFDDLDTVADDIQRDFESFLAETENPDLPDLPPNTYKCEQNFHSVKTIKFPDKPPEVSSDSVKPATDDRPSSPLAREVKSPKPTSEVATKLTNPKKRFVKSFEDFELKRAKEENKRPEEEPKPPFKLKTQLISKVENEHSSTRQSERRSRSRYAKSPTTTHNIINDLFSQYDKTSTKPETDGKISSKKSKYTKFTKAFTDDYQSDAASPSESEIHRHLDDSDTAIKTNLSNFDNQNEMSVLTGAPESDKLKNATEERRTGVRRSTRKFGSVTRDISLTVDSPPIDVENFTNKANDSLTKTHSTIKESDPEPKVLDSEPKINDPVTKIADSVPKMDESKIDDPLTKIDNSEPKPKIDKPLTKIDDSVPKVDDSVPKVDDSVPKVDDSSTKIDSSLTKQDDSTLPLAKASDSTAKPDDFTKLSEVGPPAPTTDDSVAAKSGSSFVEDSVTKFENCPHERPNFEAQFITNSSSAGVISSRTRTSSRRRTRKFLDATEDTVEEPPSLPTVSDSFVVSTEEPAAVHVKTRSRRSKHSTNVPEALTIEEQLLQMETETEAVLPPLEMNPYREELDAILDESRTLPTTATELSQSKRSRRTRLDPCLRPEVLRQRKRSTRPEEKGTEVTDANITNENISTELEAEDTNKQPKDANNTLGNTNTKLKDTTSTLDVYTEVDNTKVRGTSTKHTTNDAKLEEASSIGKRKSTKLRDDGIKPRDTSTKVEEDGNITAEDITVETDLESTGTKTEATGTKIEDIVTKIEGTDTKLKDRHTKRRDASSKLDLVGTNVGDALEYAETKLKDRGTKRRESSPKVDLDSARVKDVDTTLERAKTKLAGRQLDIDTKLKNEDAEPKYDTKMKNTAEDLDTKLEGTSTKLRGKGTKLRDVESSAKVKGIDTKLESTSIKLRERSTRLKDANSKLDYDIAKMTDPITSQKEDTEIESIGTRLVSTRPRDANSHPDIQIGDSVTSLDDVNTKLEPSGAKLECTNTKLRGRSTRSRDSCSKLDCDIKLNDTSTSLDDTDIKLQNIDTKLDRTSTKLECTSAKPERTSTKLERTSAKLERTSTKLERTSTKRRDRSSRSSNASSKKDYDPSKKTDTSTILEDPDTKLENTKLEAPSTKLRDTDTKQKNISIILDNADVKLLDKNTKLKNRDTNLTETSINLETVSTKVKDTGITLEDEDAKTKLIDKSTNMRDSGAKERDSGTKQKDSGTKERDSGAKERDSGTKERDSGAKGKNSGTKERDSGAKERHSGIKSRHSSINLKGSGTKLESAGTELKTTLENAETKTKDSHTKPKESKAKVESAKQRRRSSRFEDSTPKLKEGSNTLFDISTSWEGVSSHLEDAGIRTKREEVSKLREMSTKLEDASTKKRSSTASEDTDTKSRDSKIILKETNLKNPDTKPSDLNSELKDANIFEDKAAKPRSTNIKQKDTHTKVEGTSIRLRSRGISSKKEEVGTISEDTITVLKDTITVVEEPILENKVISTELGNFVLTDKDSKLEVAKEADGTTLDNAEIVGTKLRSRGTKRRESVSKQEDLSTNLKGASATLEDADSKLKDANVKGSATTLRSAKVKLTNILEAKADSSTILSGADTKLEGSIMKLRSNKPTDTVKLQDATTQKTILENTDMTLKDKSITLKGADSKLEDTAATLEASTIPKDASTTLEDKGAGRKPRGTNIQLKDMKLENVSSKPNDTHIKPEVGTTKLRGRGSSVTTLKDESTSLEDAITTLECSSTTLEGVSTKRRASSTTLEDADTKLKGTSAKRRDSRTTLEHVDAKLSGVSKSDSIKTKDTRFKLNDANITPDDQKIMKPKEPSAALKDPSTQLEAAVTEETSLMTEEASFNLQDATVKAGPGSIGITSPKNAGARVQHTITKVEVTAPETSTVPQLSERVLRKTRTTRWDVKTPTKKAKDGKIESQFTNQILEYTYTRTKKSDLSELEDSPTQPTVSSVDECKQPKDPIIQEIDSCTHVENSNCPVTILSGSATISSIPEILPGTSSTLSSASAILLSAPATPTASATLSTTPATPSTATASISNIYATDSSASVIDSRAFLLDAGTSIKEHELVEETSEIKQQLTTRGKGRKRKLTPSTNEINQFETPTESYSTKLDQEPVDSKVPQFQKPVETLVASERSQTFNEEPYKEIDATAASNLKKLHHRAPSEPKEESNYKLTRSRWRSRFETEPESTSQETQKISFENWKASTLTSEERENLPKITSNFDESVAGDSVASYAKKSGRKSRSDRIKPKLEKYNPKSGGFRPALEDSSIVKDQEKSASQSGFKMDTPDESSVVKGSINLETSKMELQFNLEDFAKFETKMEAETGPSINFDSTLEGSPMLGTKLESSAKLEETKLKDTVKLHTKSDNFDYLSNSEDLIHQEAKLEDSGKRKTKFEESAHLKTKSDDLAKPMTKPEQSTLDDLATPMTKPEQSTLEDLTKVEDSSKLGICSEDLVHLKSKPEESTHQSAKLENSSNLKIQAEDSAHPKAILEDSSHLKTEPEDSAHLKTKFDDVAQFLTKPASSINKPKKLMIFDKLELSLSLEADLAKSMKMDAKLKETTPEDSAKIETELGGSIKTKHDSKTLALEDSTSLEIELENATTPNTKLEDSRKLKTKLDLTILEAELESSKRLLADSTMFETKESSKRMKTSLENWTELGDSKRLETTENTTKLETKLTDLMNLEQNSSNLEGSSEMKTKLDVNAKLKESVKVEKSNLPKVEDADMFQLEAKLQLDEANFDFDEVVAKTGNSKMKTDGAKARIEEILSGWEDSMDKPKLDYELDRKLSEAEETAHPKKDHESDDTKNLEPHREIAKHLKLPQADDTKYLTLDKVEETKNLNIDEAGSTTDLKLHNLEFEEAGKAKKLKLDVKEETKTLELHQGGETKNLELRQAKKPLDLELPQEGDFELRQTVDLELRQTEKSMGLELRQTGETVKFQESDQIGFLINQEDVSQNSGLNSLLWGEFDGRMQDEATDLRKIAKSKDEAVLEGNADRMAFGYRSCDTGAATDERPRTRRNSTKKVEAIPVGAPSLAVDSSVPDTAHSLVDEVSSTVVTVAPSLSLDGSYLSVDAPHKTRNDTRKTTTEVENSELHKHFKDDTKMIGGQKEVTHLDFLSDWGDSGDGSPDSNSKAEDLTASTTNKGVIWPESGRNPDETSGSSLKIPQIISKEFDLGVTKARGIKTSNDWNVSSDFGYTLGKTEDSRKEEEIDVVSLDGKKAEFDKMLVEHGAVKDEASSSKPRGKKIEYDEVVIPPVENLTVVSEKDLAEGQVEITTTGYTEPQKSSLFNFSMDFYEDKMERSKLLQKLKKSENVIEYKEFSNQPDEKDDERAEIENIENESGDSQGSLTLLDEKVPSIQPLVIKTTVKSGDLTDMCDLEDHIPSSQIVAKENLVETRIEELVNKKLEINTEIDKTDEKVEIKLFEALSGSMSDKKSGDSKVDPKNTKLIVKSAIKSRVEANKPNKAIILSEKIIKPAQDIPSGKKLPLKRALEDPDEIERFILNKTPKRDNIAQRPKISLSKPVTPKSQVVRTTATPTVQVKSTPTLPKTSGKAKILNQTIITPSGEIYQQPKTPVVADDADFDINSMPIVLSDELPSETIENMPIVISDSAASSPTIVTTSQIQILNKTVASSVLLPRSISQKMARPPKILQPPTPRPKSSTSLLTTAPQPGKYLIIPQKPPVIPNKPTTSLISKKPPLIRRTIPGTPTNIQNVSQATTGNKIMIVTNQQGQQQRLLLTPAQQKLFGVAGATTKIAKTTPAKTNILQKTVFGRTTPTIAKSPTIAPTQQRFVTRPVKKIIAPQPKIAAQQPKILIHQQTKVVPKIPEGNLGQSLGQNLAQIKLGQQTKFGKPKILNQQAQQFSKTPQRTILIKNHQGQTVRKIQGTDDALLDQQVAEQLQAIKASGGFKMQQQEVSSPKTVPKPKRFPPKRTIIETKTTHKVSSSIPPLAPIANKKTEPTETKPQERPPSQLVLQWGAGNQTTLTEGQILALPSETVDGQPQSYMLVTVDESGNLTPLNNEALMSLDPNLGLGGDLSNVVLQYDQPEESKTKTTESAASSGSPTESSVVEMPQLGETVETPKTTEPPISPKSLVDEALESTNLAIASSSFDAPTTVGAAETSEKVSELVTIQEDKSPMPASVQVACNINGEGGQQLIFTGDPITTQKFLDSLTEGNTDLANILANAEGSSFIIQADGQQILINAEPDNQMLLSVNTEGSENTEAGGNPMFATQPPKNQDILAAALADTDVFQQEQVTSQKNPQLSPGNSLYPMHVSNVLETSLTLNSPIMTPLEVPSTNNKKIPDEEADILTQVPKNVDLPITITDPNISQTVANQQASLMATELQTNLELSLPISETTMSASSEMNSPSFVYSLPALDVPDVDITQKSFSGSMPLLTEDAEDEPQKKTTDPSFLEEGLCTLGGEMCSSLSEPPPEMFDIPVAAAEKDAKTLEEEAVNSPVATSEDSLEIPMQPQIVTALKDGEGALKRSTPSGDDSEGPDTKKCKVD